MESAKESDVPKELEEIFGYIDTQEEVYIENLSKAVAIKSVSTWSNCRPQLYQMVNWVAEKLQEIEVNVELVDIGEETLSDGTSVKRPKVILGQYGDDSSKKTICVYGHLDVQPALKEDGWDTDPFVLTRKDGKLYGRGASDDKGPILCWIHAIKAYHHLKKPLPVNLIFIIEGLEEVGSHGLDKLLVERKNGILKNVDYVCISDNYWLGKEKPCITYGLRGICYFGIEVQCASKDLHSGVYGGNICEAMSDLVYLLNSLVDVKGNILVTDIYKDVAIELETENSLYESISFDVETYKNDIGAHGLLHDEDKVKLLKYRWRYPSLSLHGIEGAFYESGAKTVIPGKVIGKFSIRIVPNQEPHDVEEYVSKYLISKWAERGSPNRMVVHRSQSGDHWVENPNHPHYTAAKRATRHVYKVEPDMTREGGSIPVAVTLQKVTGKNVLLLPVGASDDGAHSQNEKMNVSNYMQGTKLMAAYLHEIGQLQ